MDWVFIHLHVATLIEHYIISHLASDNQAFDLYSYI